MSICWRRITTLRSIVTGMCLSGLVACSGTPHPKAGRPATVQAISNEQQLTDVVAALETGDVGRARKLLKDTTRRDPSDRRVQTLVASLDGDPVAMLGHQSFAYKIDGDDRMTSLAQRFLGDRLKFYLLVRYNGLKSALLTPGQVIRIPGMAPTPAVSPVVRPRPESKPAAPATPPRASPPVATVPATNPALAGSLRGQAVKALDQGKVATAVVLLRRAKAADPGNTLVARDLARAERLLATVRARK